MAKTFKDLVAEGNSLIETLSVEDAISRHGTGEYLFLDVREGGEVANGRIPGAVHAPRGLLEFHACPTSPMYNAAIDRSKPVIVYCASGGRSALAGKTLTDLGYENVSHIGGGMGAWKENNGPVE